MEVDRKIIEGKIDIIELNIKFLEQYKESKIKEFEKNIEIFNHKNKFSKIFIVGYQNLPFPFCEF